MNKEELNRQNAVDKAPLLEPLVEEFDKSIPTRPDSDGTPVSCSKPERAIEEAPVDLESSASKEDK